MVNKPKKKKCSKYAYNLVSKLIYTILMIYYILLSIVGKYYEKNNVKRCQWCSLTTFHTLQMGVEIDKNILKTD